MKNPSLQALSRLLDPLIVLQWPMAITPLQQEKEDFGTTPYYPLPLWCAMTLSGAVSYISLETSSGCVLCFDRSRESRPVPCRSCEQKQLRGIFGSAFGKSQEKYRSDRSRSVGYNNCSSPCRGSVYPRQVC